MKREEINKELAEAKAKVKKAKEEVKLIQAKLDFMNETGAEEYCHNEFRVYQTLTIVKNGDLNKAEKAKAIASLIRNQ